MTISIVGCGQSAKEWFKTPCDLSIGVNDCVKWGKEVDWLVVVNSPMKFKGERWDTITGSKPKRFICHNGAWKKQFPKAELAVIHPFRGGVKKGKIYFSKTSPFVALNIAYQESPTDIILWGVDFLNHPNVKDKLLKTELNEYRRLFDALESKGVKVWIGNPDTVLREYLPVWRDFYPQKPSLKPISSNSTAMNK